MRSIGFKNRPYTGAVPHIVIEYSTNLESACDPQQLVDDLHAAAVADGIGPLAGLRTRGAARSVYQIADGDQRNAFVAIIARIGPGREPAEKTRFLTALLDAAEASMVAATDHYSIAFSCEVQEIDADFRVNRNYVAARLADAPG